MKTNNERVALLRLPRYLVCKEGYPDMKFFSPGQTIVLNDTYEAGVGIPDELKGKPCTSWEGNKRRFTEAFFDKYPNIFRRLNWWEFRNVNELPDYLRCIRTPDRKILPGYVLKVVGWNVLGALCKHFVNTPEEEVYVTLANGERTCISGSLTGVNFASAPICIIETGCFIPALDSDYEEKNPDNPLANE